MSGLKNLLRFLLGVKCAACFNGTVGWIPRSRVWWCRGHRERADAAVKMYDDAWAIWNEVGERVKNGGQR